MLVQKEFIDTLDVLDKLEISLANLEEKNRIFEEKKALVEVAFGFESWVSKELGLRKYEKKPLSSLYADNRCQDRKVQNIFTKLETHLPRNQKFDVRDLLDTLASMKEPRLVSCHQVDCDLQTKAGLSELTKKYLKNKKEQSFGKAILNVLCSDAIKSEDNVLDLALGIYE